MSDEQDKPEVEASDESGPRGGERLAVARRERQITVLEVAKELHLDEPKVRALERNDFDVLGAPVFAKGHLRKYAQLVGVDEADVFADYYAMTRTTTLPPLVAGRSRIRQESSPGPWIVALAVLLVAAGAYWWFFLRDDDVSPPPLAAPAESPQPATQAVPRETAQPTVAEAALPAAAAATELAPEAVPEAVPEAAPEEQPLVAGQISLSLQFSGDCWTEIIDASGRRLFFNMGRSGQTTTLRGKAPVSALFGNADNVRVQVNGSDYALPAPTSANRTVRVAIVSS